MRGRVLIAATAIVAGSLTVTWTAGRGDAALAATVNQTVLDDDFSGDRGSRPDAAVWTVWRVTDGRPDMTTLDGTGRLVLGSALRTAKTFAQPSGRAEARIQGRRMDGAWRALSALDADGGILGGSMETLAPDRVDDDAFHTYTVDWTPATLTWSVDGRTVSRFTRTNPGEPLTFVLNAGVSPYSRYLVVDQVTVQTPVEDAAKWKAFTTYQAGELVRYRKVVYRVQEAHTSLPGWQPDLVPALFAKV